ncbi:sugar ABC transporter substrate-binding protein [Candidatus Gracilibacteria bacterium]|nr:sugar ABC transporter substrate-binding protein [Candidatus Gracilibacteria bacterium]
MRHFTQILPIILFLLAACATQNERTPQISMMIFGDPAEKAAYERLVRAFADERPDIAVNLIHIPDQQDYRRRLGVDLAGGKAADIVLLNYRRYAAYAAKGVLEPLGPYLASSERIATTDFYPEALAPFNWQGQLMCIPQNLSSLVVYYNRDLLRASGLTDPAPDWTWDDLLHYAQTLTVDSDSDGQIDRYGLGSEIALNRLAPFIWQAGGALVDDDKQPTQLTLDTPEARTALQWFVDLQLKHGVVPNAVAEAAESSERRFLNGRLGMFLNSRRGVPTYRTIEGFDWDVAALPRDRLTAGVLHADAYCMPKTTQNKAATWAFIEFANSATGQTIIAESGRTVPSLRSVAESTAFLDPQQKPASSRLFLETIPLLRSVPVLPAWADIEAIADVEIERAFYGQADIDTVIDAITERTQPFFTTP